jgi:hypothetical protein
MTVLGESHVTGNETRTRRTTARKSQYLLANLPGWREATPLANEVFSSGSTAGFPSGALGMDYRYPRCVTIPPSIASIHKRTGPVLRKVMDKKQDGK